MTAKCNNISWVDMGGAIKPVVFSETTFEVTEQYKGQARRVRKMLGAKFPRKVKKQMKKFIAKTTDTDVRKVRFIGKGEFVYEP